MTVYKSAARGLVPRFGLRLGSFALAVALLGASAFSCAHGSDGRGGSGGEEGVTSAPSVTATGSAGTGVAGACDTGVFGSLLDGSTQAQQDTCIACTKCSQTDQCTTEWQSYGADPDYQAYADCNGACASGDSTCASNCTSLYPTTDAAFQTAVSCSVCQECLQNCDAVDTCM
jgi:hypothetical protein